MRKTIAAGALLASFIPFAASALTLPDFTTMLSCFQGANSDTTKIQQCTNSFADQFTSQITSSVPNIGSNFTIPVRDSASVTLTTSQLNSCLQNDPMRVTGCIDTFKNSLFSSLPSVASSNAVSVPTSQFVTCIQNAGANMNAIQACKASFLNTLPSSLQLPPTPNVSSLFGTSSLVHCITNASGNLDNLNACTRGFRTPLESILDTVDPAVGNLPPNVRTLVTCVKNTQSGDVAAIRACKDSFVSTTNPSGTTSGTNSGSTTTSANPSGTTSSSTWTLPDTTSMPQNVRTLVTCLHSASNDVTALKACHEAFRATLPSSSNTGNPPVATTTLPAATQARIDALRTQVQQLLQQIQQLTAAVDARGSQTTQASQTGTPSRPGAPARLLKRLSFGSRGDDVCTLQRFLSDDPSTGLTAEDVTCFFGKRTEQAVKNWQSSHGIVSEGDPATTGWGNVGPKTLAEINKLIDRLLQQ